MRGKLCVTLGLLVGLLTGTSLQASHWWSCGSSIFHFAWDHIFYQINATNSAPHPYNTIFRSEVEEWDSLTCIALTETTPDLTMSANFFGNTGWLGLASLDNVGSSCHVIDASALLNRTFLDNTSTYSQTNVRHVACQEVGHTFGLNHNRSSSTTCMNDTILTAPFPNSHDISSISSLYDHMGSRCP